MLSELNTGLDASLANVGSSGKILNTTTRKLYADYAYMDQGVNIGDKVLLFADQEGGNIVFFSGGDAPIHWEIDSHDGKIFRIFSAKASNGGYEYTSALSFSTDMKIFNIGDYTQIVNGGGYTNMLTSGTHFDFKNMQGNLVNIGALNFVTGSSRRYKDNIHPITTDRARKILDLDVVTYDYKQSYAADRLDLTGVIAEDCISIIPEAVICKEIDGRMVPDGVDYIKFIPYLLQMVQIQQEQIRQLQERLDSQSNPI